MRFPVSHIDWKLVELQGPVQNVLGNIVSGCLRKPVIGDSWRIEMWQDPEWRGFLTLPMNYEDAAHGMKSLRELIAAPLRVVNDRTEDYILADILGD